jgi:hypothetical protein
MDRESREAGSATVKTAAEDELCGRPASSLIFESTRVTLRLEEAFTE